ncbi:MAG TPA: uridine phosphorylase, partial [Firmicutes bacterium]|nr:uridine phosphorylase [Bacillota bacterium]
MISKEFPILEFDGVSENIIEPSKFIKKIDMPEQVIMCFYSEVIEKLAEEGKLKEIKALHS